MVCDFLKKMQVERGKTQKRLSSFWSPLSQFHFRFTWIIESRISQKVPALCQMNKLWWQIGCEWELGHCDSVQYDSALSFISPSPPLAKLTLAHKHHAPLKLLKLPFPTFRCSTCNSLTLTQPQHDNWAAARREDSRDILFLCSYISLPHRHQLHEHTFPFPGLFAGWSLHAFSACTTRTAATLTQNWTLPWEFNRSCNDHTGLDSFWLLKIVWTWFSSALCSYSRLFQWLWFTLSVTELKLCCAFNHCHHPQLHNLNWQFH